MSPHYIEQAKEYAQKEKIMRKGVILSILYVWFFSFLYAYDKDTPNPQIFKIAEKCQSIKLVIKEIYKGNKWEDTCINYIKIIPDFCSLDGFI